MDIKIEEQDGLYCVCVQIPPYDVRIKRKTIVSTQLVRQKLSVEGYETGEVVQSAHLNNLNGITQGTWFFKKKTLDKPAKPVIIVEEKSVQPKLKPATAPKKKRTRSSTKKVSTEE